MQNEANGAMASLVNTQRRQADMPRALVRGTRVRPRPCVVLFHVVVLFVVVILFVVAAAAALVVVVLPCRVTHSLRHVLGQQQRRVAASHSRTVALPAVGLNL